VGRRSRRAVECPSIAAEYRPLARRGMWAVFGMLQSVDPLNAFTSLSLHRFKLESLLHLGRMKVGVLRDCLEPTITGLSWGLGRPPRARTTTTSCGVGASEELVIPMASKQYSGNALAKLHMGLISADRSRCLRGQIKRLSLLLLQDMSAGHSMDSRTGAQGLFVWVTILVFFSGF